MSKFAFIKIITIASQDCHKEGAQFVWLEWAFKGRKKTYHRFLTVNQAIAARADMLNGYK